MTPESWQRVKHIFSAARERPPSEQASFLDGACGGDATLRAEVESLLAAADSGDLFQTQHDAVTTPMPSPYQQFLHQALANRYSVDRELGRGGMATVFLAQDLKHNRPVALKVMREEIAATLGPERFQREIMLAARLQHPHILTVLDSGQAGEQLWFTMPFVEGESLRDRLHRETQLPVDEAVRIAREVALALEYAHQHGVVHRDIKPENLLLTGDGSVMVADFGIARALGGSEQPLTGTGFAVGTPAYMSPEQASGTRGIDARTDVYALGCVLFEMLAGEPPYTGPTPQAIMARALTETPRPLHPVRGAVSEALDAVIAKALAATAADRFASMVDFARALELSGGEGRPSSWRFARHSTFAALVLSVLMVSAAGLTWRLLHRGADTPGAKLVAVLPFENLGASADDYVADGITDEVRGRLSTVPGVQVIARGSSMSYKNSTKSQQLIADELGVRFLLTATVRWEERPGGERKVHMSPELVEVERDRAPVTKWQLPFDVTLDASLTDVFQVYADIAGRVAEALGVVLGDSVRQQLAEQPTRNPEAYDAYLRGEAVSPTLFFGDPWRLRQAATHYARAVALDSMFAQAWAQLSVAHSSLYFVSTPDPAEAELALRAAERARALAPTRGEGRLALGFYYLTVAKDAQRAAEEFNQGRRVAPSNADLLVATALADQRLHLEAAVTHLQEAQTLDPRSVSTAQQLALTLLWLRRYPEAARAADRTLALAPTDLFGIEIKAMIALAQGDVPGARAVVRAASNAVGSAALAANFAYFYDLYWVLDDVQLALVLHLSPDSFDNNRGSWGIVLAQIYWLRGEHAKARIYADSARIAFEYQLQATPQDPQTHVLLGLALAYLAHKIDAVKEGQRAAALLPIANDALNAPYIQHQLARIYLLVGDPETALNQLEPLLRVPYYLSPGWLKIDPNFNPLRSNPRFHRLVAGT